MSERELVRADRADRAVVDPVHGPLLPTLIQLAWPVLLTLGLKVAFNVVDIYWVGALGPAALAALSTSSFLYWMLVSLSEAVSVGTLARVAHLTGAGDRDAAVRLAAQAMIWAALLGGLIGTLALGLLGRVYALMGVGADVARLGREFMTPIACAAPFLFAFTTADASFRGSGRPRRSMRLYSGALLLNALLDPLLIFGHGPFPRLGVRGAGIATALSFVLAAAAAAAILARDLGATASASAPRARIRLAPATLLEVLRIGLPVSANGVLFSLVYVLLTTITSRFGTAAIAALGIGHKVESVGYLTTVALGAAAATMVGQCLGAGEGARARRAAWVATGLACTVGLAAGGVFLLVPARLVGIFSGDAEVVRIGASYLVIVGLVQVFQACEVVLDGAFGGAGHTLPPMVVGVPLTLARLPLASLLALHLGLGVDGVFWAISASTAAKGVALALWFRRGTWTRKRAVAAGSRPAPER